MAPQWRECVIWSKLNLRIENDEPAPERGSSYL